MDTSAITSSLLVPRSSLLAATLLGTGCFSAGVESATADSDATEGDTDPTAGDTVPGVDGTGPGVTTAGSNSGGSTSGDTGSPTPATTGPTSADSSDSTSSGGSGDGSDTSGGSSDGSSGSDGSSSDSGVEAFCGDGTVNGEEVCDEGDDNGPELGDCAPDCSTLVVQKSIVLTAMGSGPNLAALGGGNVVENADDRCPAGYAAMFSVADQRRASITANTGDGQIDWVLAPWTAYVNADGDPIWTTDDVALLGVTGGVFGALTNPIEPGGNTGAFTGMNDDWTTMDPNCLDWSTASGAEQGMTGTVGQTTAAFLRQSQAFTYPCSNMSPRQLYCVEQ